MDAHLTELTFGSARAPRDDKVDWDEDRAEETFVVVEDRLVWEAAGDADLVVEQEAQPSGKRGTLSRSEDKRRGPNSSFAHSHAHSPAGAETSGEELDVLKLRATTFARPSKTGRTRLVWEGAGDADLGEQEEQWVGT